MTLFAKVSEDKTIRGPGLGLGQAGRGSAATGYPSLSPAPLDRSFTYIYPRGLPTLPSLWGVEIGVVRFHQAAMGAATGGGSSIYGVTEAGGVMNDKSKYDDVCLLVC